MDENNTNARHSSRLININLRFEAPNELVEKLEVQFNILNEKLEGKSDKEISDFLIASGKDPAFNEIASSGFLYGILTDIPNSKKHFSNFYQYSLSVSDGWYQALLKMNMILLEIFYKLKSESRLQLIFFFAESIKHNIPKIDNVLSNLFRTVSEGAEYKETCIVLQGICDILNANREWMRALKPNGTFAPIALLTLSRFISDQHQFGSGTNNTINGCGDLRFKNSMVSVCDFLLKERFSDMLMLGRDLVLVLMRLSKIPLFMTYWKALLYNPSLLLPKFNGLAQLMSTPCSNFALNYRVSIHIGRKVEFILKLRSLSQTKYLDWFHKAHLSSVDSSSLRADIIRHIWHNVHLAEFQQTTSIEVRAQFINWMLKNARLVSETQWCKLMLFWDWFGFDPQVPNSIQLVEPAFSLIRFLISTAPAQANSLLDYLIRMCTTLHPPLATYFASTITAAFKALTFAGMPVVAILESPRLDKPIRDALRDTFPELFPKKSITSIGNITPSVCSSIPGTSSMLNDFKEPGLIIDFDAIRSPHQISTNTSNFSAVTSASLTNNNNENASGSGSINQELDCLKENASNRKDYNSSILKKKHTKKKISSASDSEDHLLSANFSNCTLSLPVIYEFEQCSKPLSVFLPMIKEEFREHLETLNKVFSIDSNTDDDSAGEAMQNLLMAIFEDDGLEDDQSELIAECLLKIFVKYFKRRKFLPIDDISEENLNEIFENIPLYTLFRYLSMASEGDSTRRPLLMILTDMREKCGSIGYLLLYFIRSARRDLTDESIPISCYFEFCRYLNKSVETQLIEDLRQCSVQDHDLFAFLLPFVFDKMANDCIGSTEMMHLICSSIDSKQLADLIGEVMRENITFFRKDSFSNLILNSLNWETVEQMILWHLIRAEGVPIEWLLSTIPRLQYSKHSEAITNILLMLKTMDHEPSMLLLRSFMSRTNCDLFTVHALKVLIEDEDNLNRVSLLLNTLVKKLITLNEITVSSTPLAQSKSKNLKKGITVHNIFLHLDKFRLNCLTKDSRRAETLLSSQHIQEIFIMTRKIIELRSHFSELFAVMEIFSDDVNSSIRAQRKNRLRTNDGHDNFNSNQSKRKKLKDENSDEDDR